MRSTRAGHPLAARDVTMAELASYPWIVAHSGAPLRLIWEQMFADAGLETLLDSKGVVVDAADQRNSSWFDLVLSFGPTLLLVTHDVDEAVLLSDRIVMMTNGPSARIGEVLEVPLARPRKRLELATNASYLKCRQRVLEFLYERHHFVEAA
mgnify:CR=1 FL=1